MKVGLVSVTSPSIEGIKTAEELIVYCARVSNPSNQLNTETTPKLIKYLIDHKHWSPFEMASMCCKIETSRAIAAQILRHRSFSFQEFSLRYSTAIGLEDMEFRGQGKTNRQVGDEGIDIPPELHELVGSSVELSLKAYESLLKSGVARECARMVLPLVTTTTLYMNGTIRSWIHYLQVRCTPETQKEHRDIALGIKGIFEEQFPNINAAVNWDGK